ncbi:hypothetical protein CA267_001965 [Alteromonas pelagimontana]|uniref:Recombinase RecT n=1 Tax=Alteromonas pelagimontana TaxID=1858656 RepID=A0A6M4MAF8_9ALTE|nr:recombinase RecT [Alteromonas pelagimontana]QJR79650.1 hypothetical protein CA267_001965 [Alteromonas pelagimontana]
MGNLTKTTGFALAPQNLEQAMQLATMICNSQLAPNNYKGKPEDTLVAMMMGHELGLNPLQSIQNIAVINGRPSIYGDALLALVQNSPAFGGIQESFDEDTMTATCTVWRKGGEKHTQHYSKDDADTAGLWGKQGPWKQHPKRMLAMRARGFAVRNQFADALAGLVTREEAEDMEKEINPTPAPQAQSKRIGQKQSRTQYSESDFNENFPKWKAAVESGKKTSEQIISMVSTKGDLTQGMIEAIESIEAGEPA